jgi:ubiquinone/menaquinone biosynthesis C-methylase UbiE
MDHRNIVDTVNKKTYARAEVVNWYANLDFIHKPEQILLEKLLPQIKDKKILDIGIGGGRTTKYLLEISKDYTGIDYTPSCVEAVKAKYQDANIICCNARDLKIFGDNTFDFVLFSFNSMDYIIHEERIRALTEIHRVLKPGCFYMFSTHNRDYEFFNKLPWQEKPRLNMSYLKSCLYTLYYLPKHLKMKRHEIYTDEYAIINDNAHEYSLLAYYISIEKQIKQLANIGFSDIEAYDMEGRQTDHDIAFPWTYYLAKKQIA